MAKYWKSKDGILLREGDSGYASIKSPIEGKQFQKSYFSPKELKDNFPELERMKRAEYYEELNSLWRDYCSEWVHRGCKFMSGKNFKSSNELRALPKHSINSSKTMVIVFNSGSVYYTDYLYSGCYGDRIQLYDVRTYEFRKWTRVKNCSAVYNMDTKEFV